VGAEISALSGDGGVGGKETHGPLELCSTCYAAETPAIAANHTTEYKVHRKQEPQCRDVEENLWSEVSRSTWLHGVAPEVVPDKSREGSAPTCLKI
jgi:hypothetical protein